MSRESINSSRGVQLGLGINSFLFVCVRSTASSHALAAAAASSTTCWCTMLKMMVNVAGCDVGATAVAAVAHVAVANVVAAAVADVLLPLLLFVTVDDQINTKQNASYHF